MSIRGILTERFGDLSGSLQIGASAKHGLTSVLRLDVIYEILEHEGTLVLSPVHVDSNINSPLQFSLLQKKIKQKIDQLLSVKYHPNIPTLFVGGSRLKNLNRIQIKAI